MDISICAKGVSCLMLHYHQSILGYIVMACTQANHACVIMRCHEHIRCQDMAQGDTCTCCEKVALAMWTAAAWQERCEISTTIWILFWSHYMQVYSFFSIDHFVLLCTSYYPLVFMYQSMRFHLSMPVTASPPVNTSHCVTTCEYQSLRHHL